MFKGFFKRTGVIIFTSVSLAVASNNIVAQTKLWTLESAVQRVVEQAPERRVAEAEVKAREGELHQAGAWPNPTIGLGASNAMGKEDGQGGIDLDQLSVYQPIPLSGRLGLQRKEAAARLKQAEAGMKQQGLLLEYEAARAFHSLQLSHAQLNLAQQQLESADEFQHIGRRREQAGDLSRLERLRLDVVRESAKQLIDSAEGRYSESLSAFKTLLNLAKTTLELAMLEHSPTLPQLNVVEAQLEAHPVLKEGRQAIEAASQGVAVARAKRFVDPELWLAHERSVLGVRRQDATVFGVSVTVPLWDRGKGNIDVAQANRSKAKFKVEALQRQLSNQLRLNHLHLSHLIEQTQEYRIKVLEPADEIFRLTRKSFAAGQVEIINLVDAVDTYYGARIRYLELLHEGWLEAAGLRLSAGHSLLDSQPPISPSTIEGAAQ